MNEVYFLGQRGKLWLRRGGSWLLAEVFAVDGWEPPAVVLVGGKQIHFFLSCPTMQAKQSKVQITPLGANVSACYWLLYRHSVLAGETETRVSGSSHNLLAFDIFNIIFS